MGVWGFKINESDAFMNVYDRFFRGYNRLAYKKNCDLDKEVKKIVDSLLNDGDWMNAYKHDLFFALGLACWEVGKLSADLLKKITYIIKMEEYLKGWAQPELKKKETLKFLKKIKSVNLKITLPAADEINKPTLVKDVLSCFMPHILLQILNDKDEVIFIEKVENMKDQNLLDCFVEKFDLNSAYILTIKL